ncbi:MAG: hypothetical protein VYE77_04310 [Planctomycetota bacterium]|nr:hypothetical protein [Planctomycetota bacterium]
MSEPHPSHELQATAPVRQSRAAVWLSALALAWLLASLPFLAVDAAERLPDTLSKAHAALTLSVAERLEQEIAVSPEVMEALTDRLGEGSRLVVYCPYPEPIFVNLVRLQYERLKNLLYPEPRDVRFARSPEELAGWIDAKFDNKLVVLDGTQGPVDLPVPGEFELMTEQAVGEGGRLRYWLLRKAGP